MTTYKNIRFCDNNFAELISANIEYSSALAAFPFENVVNRFRSKLWKPSGLFEIYDGTTGFAANNKLYINDGTNKTVTLTASITAYTTPQLFATHIQTQLNAASTGWTVTYDTAGKTYKFTIAHSGSATLRLSQNTDSCWDVLGFKILTDKIGTSFVADEPRNHTSEWCIFDMGYQADIKFFALVGPLQYAFQISSNSTIRLQGSNLNQWFNSPFDVTLDRTDGGVFKFLDDYADSRFRFYKFSYVDRTNPVGPTGISLGHIFIGDYITFTNRNADNGFIKILVDETDVKESENGALYFSRKTKYSEFRDIVIRYLDRADKDNIELLFNKLGVSTPFYISLDPKGIISDRGDELTKYVIFAEYPRFTHVIFDKFSVSFDVKEAI
jgi:hypothetical protein